MVKKTTWWIIATVLLLGSLPCARQQPAAQEPCISFGPLQKVTEEDQFGNPQGLTEFTVTVQPAEEGEQPQRFVVRQLDDILHLDEQPRGEIVEDRLLITTDVLSVVFDLKTGEQLLQVVAGAEVAVAENGRRVAFETLQRKFLPREATSSVIQVLDVPTLQIEPVFPQRSTIEPSQSGRLLAWVEEPADRHSAGKLSFSSDSTRLVFFCTHKGGHMPDVRQEIYLVVIDLSRGVDESRFIHRPFDWEAHLRPEADISDRRLYFNAESLKWRDDNTIVVKTPDRIRWLEDEIVVELPGPNDWSSADAQKQGH